MSTARNQVPRLNLRALEEEVTGKAPGDKRIVINVGGQKHETMLSTVEKIPGTRLALLGHMQEADETFDITTGEYFFDRHPKAFDTVLHYHRTEELHIDKGACGNVMKGELLFWGIEENEIEPCCWADYSRYTEHKDTLKDLDDNFAYNTEEAWEGPHTTCRATATKIWRFLEDPTSSRLAKLYAVTSMFFVALSIAIFVLESHPLFQVDNETGKPMSEILPKEDTTPTGSLMQCCCIEAPNATYNHSTHPALVYLDYVCVAFFTLEVIVRFSFCPHKLKFFRSPLNIIDLICLVPHYASIFLSMTKVTNAITSLVRAIMVLRIVRILRIFKLMKHYNAFKILVYTIKVSTKELLLMVVFLMSGVLMFASIIHYAEPTNFPNIPIAIWWALVTMTTVGYGDKYPINYVGYGVGSLSVICGVLVIAFTVPIVVNNFSLYYSHAQTRIKVPKRKKRLKIKELMQINKNKNKTTAKAQQAKHASNTADVALTNRNTNFSTLPTVTSRVESKQIGNHGNRTARAEDNHTTATKDRTSQRTGHGGGTERRKATTVSPIEVSDIESCDSGYTEPKNKKIEEETQKILSDMAESDRKIKDERKRQQENLTTKRREQRAKRKAPKGDDPKD